MIQTFFENSLQISDILALDFEQILSIKAPVLRPANVQTFMWRIEKIENLRNGGDW